MDVSTALQIAHDAHTHHPQITGVSEYQAAGVVELARHDGRLLHTEIDGDGDWWGTELNPAGRPTGATYSAPNPTEAARVIGVWAGEVEAP